VCQCRREEISSILVSRAETVAVANDSREKETSDEAHKFCLLLMDVFQLEPLNVDDVLRLIVFKVDQGVVGVHKIGS
jgi:hypothetical protein